MSKYPILDYLINRNIIDANTTNKGLEISEDSLYVIEAGLKEIIFDERYIKIDKENSNINNKQKVITKLGKHHIFHKYDWNSFGDGVWRKYHDDLLENIKTVSSIRKPKEGVGFDYSQLLPEKHVETDLNIVFRKKLPPYIKQDLFEANNYIINRWLILESINFFHSIEGNRPSMDDVAYVCLTSYRTKLLGHKLQNEKTLREMREIEMRKDINRFKDVGLIDIRKKEGSKKEFYGITSLKFKDSKNTYALMYPERIREEYQKINIRI